MPSIYSTSTLPQGIAIYANATLFPLFAQDGEQAVAADTNTLYIYDSSVPGWQPVANPGAAIAIDALTGEVTATGPGVVAATITAGAVTNAKLAAMANNSIKGNKSGVPASPSDLALSSLSEAVSSILTITNGSNAIVASSDLTIEVAQSSLTQDGYLSSTDFSLFYNKQPFAQVDRITKSANYNVASTDDYIGCDTNSASFTLSLPAASSVADGKKVIIKDEGGFATTNPLSISPNGTDKIDGVNATYSINVNFESVTLVCNGVDAWFII